MGIRGIGGVFFRADDPESLAAWYDEHLGIGRDDEGFATWAWREIDRPSEVGQTVWAPFPRDTSYFGSSDQKWMINYRVDDLDAELARLAREGVELLGEPESFEYGTFAWGRDLEGNKFELWEPSGNTGFTLTVPPSAAADAAAPLQLLCEPGHVVAASGGMSDTQIVVETTVSLSVKTVWELWTTSEGLAKWLVPNSNVELRLGGPYEFLFVPENDPGQQGGEGNKVLSFVPNRMLSFTWNAPPTLPYTRNRHTFVVVDLAQVEAGTRVRLTHLGWPTEEADDHPAWPKTIEYFELAWNSVFEALERYAADEDG